MRIKNCACMYTKYSKYNSNFTRSSVFKITYQSICQILSCRFCLTGKKNGYYASDLLLFFISVVQIQSKFGPSNSDRSNTTMARTDLKVPSIFLIYQKKKTLLEQIPQTVELVNNKITSFTMPNSNITIYLTDVRYS